MINSNPGKIQCDLANQCGEVLNSTIRYDDNQDLLHSFYAIALIDNFVYDTNKLYQLLTREFSHPQLFSLKD